MIHPLIVKYFIWKKQCRGQGLASRLLLHSISVAKENQCQFSILHSSKPHLQEYYHKLGWSKTASISYGIWRVDLPNFGDNDGDDIFKIRGKFCQYYLYKKRGDKYTYFYTPPLAISLKIRIIIRVLCFSDIFYFDKIVNGHDINQRHIKQIHEAQNHNLFGRLRNESDWRSLYNSWKNAKSNDPRAKFIYVLETQNTDNVSTTVAYAVFHIDECNKYAKVINSYF